MSHDEIDNPWAEEGLAYHEAGHAVMGTLRGMHVVSVSIVPDEKSDGRCVFPGAAQGCIDVMLGGLAAETIEANSQRLLLNTRCAAFDRAEVMPLVHDEAEFDRRAEDVRAVLAEPRNWRSVKAIVNAIMRDDCSGTLDGDHVRTLIRNA